MNGPYYPPNRPWISRKQSFSVGLAVGLALASLTALILSLFDPRPRAPRFSELALICLPIQTAPDDSPYRPARLDPPAQNSFTCFGGTRP